MYGAGNPKAARLMNALNVGVLNSMERDRSLEMWGRYVKGEMLFQQGRQLRSGGGGN